MTLITPMVLEHLETNIELQDYLMELSARGMSYEGVDQVEAIMRSCWDKGVDIILDPGLEDAFGTYNSSSNVLTLGADALDCNIHLIETLEHEFIHVLQDQMAGIHNSDMSALGIPTSDYAGQMVDQGYSHLDDHTQRLEQEAFTGEQMMDAGGIESFFV